jgi:hypothetical protein
MEKQELVKIIVNLHKEMYDTFRRFGISAEHLAYRTRNLEGAEMAQLDFVYRWLKYLHDTEYTAILKARALVTEEVWQYYEHVRLEGAQEQIILERAIKAAKYVWLCRPHLLQKKFSILGKGQIHVKEVHYGKRNRKNSSRGKVQSTNRHPPQDHLGERQFGLLQPEGNRTPQGELGSARSSQESGQLNPCNPSSNTDGAQ